VGYRFGRFLGKTTLIIVGYLIGRRWGRKSIDEGYPEKNQEGGI
jgi:CDP-diglyceride synthetase